MKECIHQKKHGKCKILCKRTGIIRNYCPIDTCKFFRPTLRYRLFGKW